MGVSKSFRYGLFHEEYKKQPGSVWIMKPIGKAQGKGIFLFNKLSQISEWRKDHKWKADSPQAETYIVQRYIENPYLIGGKKFDLRIYVMVTSYNPLTVYLYRSGFGRFSNERFSMRKDEIQNNFIHLTNVAIQKTNPEYQAGTGCKWSLRSLKLYLMSKHGPDAVNESFYEVL
uniref:Tubulin--tyrosine ligase-like protein 9 n=1 Tax=Palpitomonas bilix TaxID=652834 RepID=A0A7S3D9R4_9EUKA|mmetsp:Transcript_28209/g.71945  ORF Transcript_28209/g.71945 Transcript_28209/m.71945 type:complete len:174 (+) Transcript_28209:582-1103(+)